MPEPFVVRKYKTGDLVPETGIYNVTHDGHRLQHQVVIIRDEKFPRCGKCADSVFFELAYPAPGVREANFIRVYELPEVEEA
ncbi:MAG: hypothetical protein DMG65_05590 [Candidatus Angelobacter sp. Gp1-AA117]|nr:MAG: hypothetical protein DMG65_05590 [Candidatus Angelobacter sp. Gp1-AA117]